MSAYVILGLSVGFALAYSLYMVCLGAKTKEGKSEGGERERKGEIENHCSIPNIDFHYELS